VSLCLYVTSRCSTETAKHRITQTTPHDSTGNLVFGYRRSRQNSNRITPNGGAKFKCRWDMLKLRLSTNICYNSKMTTVASIFNLVRSQFYHIERPPLFAACLPWRKVPWAETYLRTKWHLDASSCLVTIEMRRKLGRGTAPFLGRGRGFPSNTKSPGQRPTSIPSGILIYAALCPQQIWAETWGCTPLGEGVPI